MKHVNTYLKYLLVALLGFGMALTTYAQSPDAVFDQISASVSKGDAASLGTHFSTTVEVTAPGTDQVYSSAQAVFVLKEFFTKNPVRSFSVAHKGSSGATWYLTGTYTASTGTFDTNIFVKKVADKFQITQIRFESE